MVLFSDSDVQCFIDSEPNRSAVENLNKSELKLLASALGVTTSRNITKPKLLYLVLEKMFGDHSDSEQPPRAPGDFQNISNSDHESEDRESSSHLPSSNPNISSSEAVQLELAKIRLKEKEMEVQCRLREKEMEVQSRLREKELELEFKRQHPDPTATRPSIVPFDISKNIKLVPPFNASDPTSYFQMFEKVAGRLSWPKDSWSALVQSVLTGKAQETYIALPVEQCYDYDKLKTAILRAYELVPEEYRLRFRTASMKKDQTFAEYLKYLTDLFDQWVRGREINGDYQKLKDLIILENFLYTIPQNIADYLIEKEITNLSDVPDAAANRSIFLHKRDGRGRKVDQAICANPSSYKQANVSIGSGSNTATERKNPSKSQGSIVAKKSFKTGRFCQYCNRTGHTEEFCWKKSGSGSKPKPIALISSKGCNGEQPLTDRQNSGRACPQAANWEQLNNNSQTPLVPVSSNSIARVVQPTELVENSDRPLLNLCSSPVIEQSESSQDNVFSYFLSKGIVSTDEGANSEVTILRDTGASQSLMLKGTIDIAEPNECILLQGIADFVSVPLVRVKLQSDLVTGPVIVGIVDQLPVKGVTFLLGNDLAGGQVSAVPQVTQNPLSCNMSTDVCCSPVFSACAVTRAMAAKADHDDDVKDVDGDISLADTFFATLTDSEVKDSPLTNVSQGLAEGLPLTNVSQRLADLQRVDSDIAPLIDIAVLEGEGDTELNECYYLKPNGILMRRWKPPHVAQDHEWENVHQVVVPKEYRQDIMSLAHDSSLAGHLGVRKTLSRIWQHFYWPNIRRDVSQYCKSCHVCQLVGKSNKPIPTAPLIPLPVFEAPFTRVLIDIVGPLPKTSSGHQYILTMLDMATRYPEAIPLRNISAKMVVKELLNFFTRFGLPKEVQSDQGSNFLSKVFRQTLKELGISQITSSAYHPQSQGALERYHQTLKTMIRKYCVEHEKDWDKGLPFLLFATRETPSESLGYSPFQLIFGHEVRGPLKLLKEQWIHHNDQVNLLEYVSKFKERLSTTLEVARTNLEYSQGKMKKWYDRSHKARDRVFHPGDLVLALIPMHGQPLKAKFSGPYVVEERVGEVDYVIQTPDRRKERRRCHVNMLKEYHSRDGADPPSSACIVVPADPGLTEDEGCPLTLDQAASWRDNQEAWDSLTTKLSHLTESKREGLLSLLKEFPRVFKDSPGRTEAACHDVDVGDNQPVKQSPYRASPQKQQLLQKELDYMLQQGLIEPCQSEWCSPVTLVPKPGGSYRFCIDYRKVNSLTKTDTYPLPRVDDCIDRIGSAKYITKLDLLKGYWQVPLTERAQDISCFVACGNTYRCKVMPYGMKNAPATFQRLMNGLTKDLHNCVTYIDDVVVYSDTWEEHLSQLHALFHKLSNADLVINLTKCDFCKAQVQYLGYMVGLGQVSPPNAKVEAIVSSSYPKNKRELQRFLGMVGYYRRFVLNFSILVAPLTDLLKKGVKYQWSAQCEQAFTNLKAVLASQPVLQAPDFNKPFKLAVDASGVGAGAVLLQDSDQGIEMPVCYFSKKFNQAQKNYSTIEKELLALILALQHFSVYLGSGSTPIQVYTDHHPLKFLAKFKDKNQRLTRWALFLQEYSLDIKHIKGVNNVLADCLSRM